jgi:tape measure domain-containing protein
MTTINNYKVTLGLDASGLVRGATLARGEFQKIQRMFREAQNPAERLEDEINLLDKALNSIRTQKPEADLSHLEEVMTRLYQRYDNVTGAEKKRIDAMKAEENELQRLIGFEQQAERAFDKTRTQVERVEHEIRQLEQSMSQLKMAGQTSELQRYNDALERMYKQLDWVTGGEAKHLANMKSQEDELNRLIKLEQQAADIFKKRMTATDIFAQERASLYELKRANLLTEEEYKAELKLARAKMMEANADKELAARRKEAIALIDRHTPKVDQLRNQYELLRKEYHSIAAASRVLGSEEDILRTKIVQTMRALRDQMNEMNKQSSGSSGSGGGFFGGFTGRMIAKAGGAIAAVASAREIYNLTVEADKANIALKQTESILQAISGSDIQGSKLITDIRQLTRQMPLGFKAAADAAKNMMAYGFSARDVVPAIKQIGIITAGNAERFANLSNAIAQMRGNTRLMGQELIQSVNAGWNPLNQIAIDTGKSIPILKKEMEEGKISFDMVAKALENATNKTGTFGSVSEKIMGTVAGKAALLASKWEESMARMGEAIEPISIAWKEFLINGIEKTTELIETTSKLMKMATSSEKPSTTPTWSRWMFGDISALGMATRAIDRIRFEAMGGGTGEFFGQPSGMPNSEKAVEAMSRNVELMKLVGKMREDQFAAEAFNRENLLAYNLYLQRQTEEQERQNKLADEAAQKDAERNRITAEEVKLQEQLDAKYERMMDKLRVRLEQLQEGDAAALAMKADLAGLNELQVQEIECLATQVEYEEEQLRLKQEKLKEDKRLLDLVEKYDKKTQTIAERTAKDFMALEGLLNAGKISFDQFIETKDRMLAEASQQQFGDSGKMNIGPKKALEYGSAEAINAVINRMNDPVEIQLRQLKEQQNQAQLLKNIETAIKDNAVGAIR